MYADELKEILERAASITDDIIFEDKGYQAQGVPDINIFNKSIMIKKINLVL